MPKLDTIVSIKPEPDDKGRRKGIVRPRIDDELGRRRISNPFWDFYHLGTRLRSVSSPSDYLTGIRAVSDISAVNTDPSRYLEYVGIHFTQEAELNQIQGVGVPLGEVDVYNVAQVCHLQTDPDDAGAVAAWDSVLLGLNGDATNPFSTTQMNHSGARAIPNCMPVKYDATLKTGGVSNHPCEAFTLYPYTETQDPLRTHYNSPASPSGPEWKTPDVPPDTERLPQELWNPLCLEQPTVLNPGVMEVERRGRIELANYEGVPIQLRMRSTNAWENFDTGDTDNYKVTTEPSFASPEVPFEATDKTPLKFFLKPRWFGFYRGRGYSYTVTWQYETYRTPFGDGTYFNAISGPTFTSPFGDPFYNASYHRITSVRDNAVSDGTGTLTFNRFTGDFSVTGPGGTISGNAPVSIPGFRGGTASNTEYEVTIQFASSGVAVPDESYNAPYTRVWTSYGIPFNSPVTPTQNFGLTQTYAWAIGAHVGMFPAFPRMIYRSTYGGVSSAPFPNPRTYSDGSTKLYEPAVAATFTGYRQLINCSGDSTVAESYRRHAERDGEAFLYLRSKGSMFIRIPPATGSWSDHPVDAPIAHGVRTTEDGTDASVAAANADLLAEVTGAFSGQPHFRNVVINDSPTETLGEPTALPLDLPVGALCGVIVKGATKYYIWRKTAETRRTYDYHRSIVDFSMDTDQRAYLDS